MALLFAFAGGCDRQAHHWYRTAPKEYPAIKTKGDYVLNILFPTYRMGYRFGAYMDSPLPGEISERRRQEVRDGMAE